MARLTREQLLSKGPELKTVEIELDDWGGSLLVRALSGKHRKSVESALMKFQNTGNQSDVRELVAVFSIVDDEGEPYFSMKEKELLSTFSGKELDKIFMRVLDISGMSEDAQKLASEDLEKNPTSRHGSD